MWSCSIQFVRMHFQSKWKSVDTEQVFLYKPVGLDLQFFRKRINLGYWPFQGGYFFCGSFMFYVLSVLCLLCLCVRLFICALWSPAGKGLTSWLPFVVTHCEFVTYSLEPWVRCGTWLYRFLIFAPLLTLSSIWVFNLKKQKQHFQEHFQCAKQFGSRSGPTVCLTLIRQKIHLISFSIRTWQLIALGHRSSSLSFLTQMIKLPLCQVELNTS